MTRNISLTTEYTPGVYAYDICHTDGRHNRYHKYVIVAKDNGYFTAIIDQLMLNGVTSIHTPPVTSKKRTIFRTHINAAEELKRSFKDYIRQCNPQSQNNSQQQTLMLDGSLVWTGYSTERR